MQSDFDDMDELWRKAGAEFPLHTGGADWDKVAAKLGIAPELKRKDRRYLWLLLLLLVPVVCMRPFPLGLGKKAPVAAVPHEGSQPAAPAAGTVPVAEANAEGGSGANRISTGRATSVPGSQQSATENGNNSKVQNTASPVAVGTKGGATVAAATAGNTSGDAAAPTTHQASATRRHAAVPTRVAAVKNRPATKIAITGAALAGRRTGGRRYPVATTKATGTDQPAVTPDAASSNAGSDVPQTQLATVVTDATPAVAGVSNSVDLPKKTDTVAAVQKPPVADTMIATETPNAATVKKPRVPRFYAGLVGGVGITTVKRQRVQAPGYDIGVALGYQFSRHFSVEADVLWSRKNYYSHGKYLKNDLSYLPQYSYVRAVDGDCRMIEIPFNLQYHFRFRKKGNWFATGGFSSYLMKREDYGYDVKNYFNGYEGHYDTTLRNATRDWMAMLQLSAGYRFQLRRNYSFRLEPYVQLPLGDAGAGRLPLTSYGLRVALLKNIF